LAVGASPTPPATNKHQKVSQHILRRSFPLPKDIISLLYEFVQREILKAHISYLNCSEKMQDRKALPDSDKLLLLIDSAHEVQTTIDSSEIDYFVFLLHTKGVKFGYRFYFPASLYSQDLHDDLETLEEGGFITAKSPIRMTEKGRLWIQQSLPNEESGRLYDLMKQYLKMIGPVDELTLFQRAYAIATRGI